MVSMQSWEEKYPIIKRIKSLLWRALMMGFAVVISVMVDNLTSLQLSPLVTTLIGLVLGEISKWINTQNSSANGDSLR